MKFEKHNVSTIPAAFKVKSGFAQGMQSNVIKYIDHIVKQCINAVEVAVELKIAISYETAIQCETEAFSHKSTP